MEGNKKTIWSIVEKIFLTLLVIVVSFIYVYSVAFLAFIIEPVIIGGIILVVPSLIIPIWCKKRKIFFSIWGIFVLLVGIALCVNYHDEKLKIETDISIDITEYMPFGKKSKIVKLDKEASLKLTENLPRLDGAEAVFPVYSAFVNAVYPENTDFSCYYFNYSNTVKGYKLLATKDIDIFFGAYPSKEQIEYASDNDTEFEYIEIGREGFVFFVNKDNPVDNLTSEQIKGIYSGKITNWKEVGGKNEKIVAFQRNEGSGSQSMLKRFMGEVEIMPAPKEKVNYYMYGIIEQVSDYRNYSNSIGFSFRYYLEELIANPNVKMISVDGVAPTIENISNKTYPITTNLYAVTYKGNENTNVKLFLDWILSDEGQEIIEKTGYAKVVR